MSDKGQAKGPQLTDQMVRSFVSQARDQIDALGEGLLELEKNPQDHAIIDNVFRQIHTLKGNAGFLGLQDFETLGHAIEDIFSRARSNQGVLTQDNIALLMGSLDYLMIAVNDLEQKGNPNIADLQKILIILKDVKLAPVASPASNPKVVESAAVAPAAAKEANANEAASAPSLAAGVGHVLIVDDDPISLKTLRKILEKSNYTVTSAESGADAMSLAEAKPNGFDVLITDLYMPGMSGSELIDNLNRSHPYLPCIITSGNSDVSLYKGLLGLEVVGFLEKPFQAEKLLKLLDMAMIKSTRKKMMSTPIVEAAHRPDAHAAASEVRVDLGKLDVLLNLVGELLIADAMISHHPDIKDLNSPGFSRTTNYMHQIVTALQDVSLSLRMVPVESLFFKMKRLTHDLGNKFSKQIELVLEGEETELDRYVIEKLSDPLVHMIRNAVDHGLEQPEQRVKLGKKPQGMIFLKAEQSLNEVVITLRDDGAGIDKVAVHKKASDLGMATRPLADYSDNEIYEFIFAPGFSTAKEVTDVSGRGVGMDVVRRNLEEINGKIRIKSTMGRGTEFIIQIPLTLSTMKGMIIRVGTRKFTIPIGRIRESFKPEADKITRRPDGQLVIKVRNEVLPVIKLGELYAIPGVSFNEEGVMLILESGEKAFCVWVDEILYQHETVIKTLDGHVSGVQSLSGCNILGNGEIALIINVDGLLEQFEKAS